MKLQSLSIALLSSSVAFAAVVKRDSGDGFKNGQPIDGKGKGAPILGTSGKEKLHDLSTHKSQAVPTTRSTSTIPPTSASKAPTLARYRI